MSYATPSDFINRYDVNRIGQLASDSGTPVPAGGLLTNGRVQAALDDGSALINAACLRGHLYDEGDLLNLLSAGTEVQIALLLRLNCDLAYGLMVAARGYTATEIANLAPSYIQAQRLLVALGDGENLFTLGPQQDAGVIVEPEPFIGIGGQIPTQGYELVSRNHRLFGRRHTSFNGRHWDSH